MRAPSTGVVITGLVMSACGSTPTVVRAPRRVEEPAVAEVSIPARVEIVQVLDASRALDLGAIGGAERALVLGGMRVAKSGGRWTLARDIVDGTLIGGVAAQGAWRFSSAGSRWRADAFLGALSDAGANAEPILRGAPSIGTIAAILGGRGGRLVQLDAEGRGRPMSAMPMSGGSFLDETHGLGIVAGGMLALTEDAGQSWRRVPISEVALDVTPVSGRWAVRVDDGEGLPGTRWVSRDGGHGDFDVSVARADMGADVIAELLRDVPAWLAADADAPWVAGRLLAALPGTRDVVRVDPVARTVERLPRVLPSDDCTLRRWGSRLAAVCVARDAEAPSDPPEGDGEDESDEGDAPRVVRSALLHASEDGRTFGPGLAVESAVVLGRDGRSAAWGGAVRVLRASGGAPVAIPVELHAARVLDVAGDVAVAAGTEGPHGEEVASILRATTADTQPLASPDRGQPRATPGAPRVELFDEGRLAVICGLTPEIHARCWRGPLAGPWSEIGLPEGVVSVGFADRAHGLAVGTTLGEVWRTVDGEHWEPIVMTATAEPSGVTLFRSDAPAGHPRVRCFPERCVVESEELRVVVWGWDAPRPTETRMLPDRSARSADSTGEPPSFVCTRSNESRLPESRPSPRRWEVRAGSGSAQISLDGNDDSLRIRASWSGRDARGAYSVSSVSAVPPDGVTEDLASPRVHVVLLRRDTLVFTLGDWESARLLRATARGAVVALGEQMVSERDSPRMIAHVFGDGTVATVARTELGGQSPVRANVTLYDTTGGVMAGEMLRFAYSPDLFGLTTWRNEPALLASLRGVLIAYPLSPGGAASPPLPTVLEVSSSPSLCRGRRTPDAVELTTDDGLGLNEGLGHETMMGELRADGWCVRAVESYARYRGGRLEATADGTLSGTVVAGDRTASMRCVAE